MPRGSLREDFVRRAQEFKDYYKLDLCPENEVKRCIDEGIIEELISLSNQIDEFGKSTRKEVIICALNNGFSL
jgi:hypothetical protein